MKYIVDHDIEHFACSKNDELNEAIIKIATPKTVKIGCVVEVEKLELKFVYNEIIDYLKREKNDYDSKISSLSFFPGSWGLVARYFEVDRVLKLYNHRLDVLLGIK